MATIINTIIASVIASLTGIPMTLESGLTFPIGNWSPAEATRIIMNNSPFYISMISNGGIQLTNSEGQWITRTSPIIKAISFDNGYCAFLTENGHKYNFTTFEKTPVVQQKWMKKPVAPVIKQYDSFSTLPLKEQVYFENHMDYYFYCSQNGNECRYAFGHFEAKRADYGFVNGVFCHISDSEEKITSLLNYDGKNVVGRIVETPRGYKMCGYIFEREFDFDDFDDYDEPEEPDAYLKTVIALETAAQHYYLKEVNDRIKKDAEWQYERAMKQYNKQMEIQSLLGFHAVNIEYECDHRAYCDNKTTSIFEFSRPISREEFFSFLKEMGEEEKVQEAWYSPYTIIKGSGDKWTYTYVSPSTH